MTSVSVSSNFELFSQELLGRSAGAIYELLSEEPRTISELSRATGKVKKTVRLALRKLG